MMENGMLVLWSFLASLGFGLLFRIVGRNLFWAGVGGAFSRFALLLAMAFTSRRVAYTLFAAMCASGFAKFIAYKFRQPSSILLYPAIIPLIPADLLYNMMVGVVLCDSARIAENAVNLAMGLSGLCVGFVLMSTISYYMRRKIFIKHNFSAFLADDG